MAPPAKKQKVNPPPKSPIIFQSPGLKPEVSLKIFNVEFHVHSVLLKLHSAFFRKFLDSPDKIVPPADSTIHSGNGSASTTPPEASALRPSLIFSNFKYTWVTKADDDDFHKWHLVADDQKNEPLNHENFKCNKKLEVDAFEKLLCTIYVLPYSISDSKALTKLSEMADYYRVLPIVSRTLSHALFDSHDFISNIRYDSCAVLEAAAKLRHKTLFRDALVWAVGNWNKPDSRSLSNTRLRQVARYAYGEIAEQVALSSSRIFIGFAAVDNDAWSDKFRDAIFEPQENWSKLSDYLRNQGEMNFPKFFRRVLEYQGLPEDIDMDDLNIPDLLRNNLVLDRTTRLPGKDHTTDEDYFLCAEIDDEDPPWDLNETDW